MGSKGHRVGEPNTDQAVALWLAVPSSQPNLERPSRETVEAYGHRVVHAEAVARVRELREDLAGRAAEQSSQTLSTARSELAGFDRVLRALGLGEGI